MATTFYLRSANIGLSAAPRLADLVRGAAATSVNGTTNGSTWVSLALFTVRLLAPFTLAGSVSMNLRGLESANQANATLGLRLRKYSAGSLGASFGQATGATELGTTESARAAAVTPTSTAFGISDILVFEVGIVNVGTMGTGQTVTFFFNGPTAAASGDSYVTLTENVTFQDRARTLS